MPDPRADPLFELDSVGLVRDGRELLADVTWRVDHGDRWAVLGANGCGKTTLLRLALGRLWPTAGTIRRLGRELLDLPAFWKRVGWIADSVATQIPADEPAADTVLSGTVGQFGLRLLPGLEPSAADRARAAARRGNGSACSGHGRSRPTRSASCSTSPVRGWIRGRASGFSPGSPVGSTSAGRSSHRRRSSW